MYMGDNAYFQIEIANEGVFLLIFPPKDGGESLSAKEVTNYLVKYGVTRYSVSDLNEALANRDESVTKKIKIGDVGSIVSADETMSLDVTLDKMQVIARFYPPSNNGKILEIKDILDNLSNKGITYGILQKEILSYIKNRKYCTDIVLAQGSIPVDGTDAQIKYYFNTDLNMRPKTNEDGTVDYRELNMISHIKEGDLLAELIREDPGKIGIDVFGKETKPRTVKTRRLEYGKDIRISEDQTKIYSEITGHAKLDKGKVIVSNVFEVAGDIDNSTGNIQYNGSVIIKGNVRSGFKVIAQGDIIIEGIVEDATVISEDQIIVKRGIHGANRGVLQANKNIVCKFIENARIISGGYVETETILHSKVDAFTEVRVSGKKGFIAGGYVRAGSLIEAMNVGTEMETITRIEVGIDPTKKERFNELQKQISDVTKKIEQIKPILINYKTKLKKGVTFTKDKVDYIRVLVIQMQNLQSDYTALDMEFQELHRVMKSDSTGRIKISNKIYPGVTVVVSEAMMTIKDTKTFSQFYKEDGLVKISSL